jgi:hypothetical protein
VENKNVILTYVVQWCSGRESCLCAGGREFETYHRQIMKLDVHASPNKFFFFLFYYLDFFRFIFCRVLLFAECFLALGKGQKALGKDVFADEIAAECPLLSVTLGKAFAECNRSFAECPGHSAKPLIPVVQPLHAGVAELSESGRAAKENHKRERIIVKLFHRNSKYWHL